MGWALSRGVKIPRYQVPAHPSRLLTCCNVAVFPSVQWPTVELTKCLWDQNKPGIYTRGGSEGAVLEGTDACGAKVGKRMPFQSTQGSMEVLSVWNQSWKKLYSCMCWFLVVFFSPLKEILHYWFLAWKASICEQHYTKYYVAILNRKINMIEKTILNSIFPSHCYRRALKFQ